MPTAALQLAGGPALGQDAELQSSHARATYLLQDSCGQFLSQLLLVVPQVTGLILLVLQRDEENGCVLGAWGTWRSLSWEDSLGTAPVKDGYGDTGS